MIGIGDTLVDNDPRSKGRRVVVIALIPGIAKVENESDGRITFVSLSRIHEDDKPRRTGFTVVEHAKKS